jgi:hypothetical protein
VPEPEELLNIVDICNTVYMRVGLESRRDELLSSISEFDKEEAYSASAELFFGGRPVVGGRGIESEFGGNVLTKFQDLVAKLLAQESGALGQRGVVPKKAAATLHVTNIVRGSFGFLLEEIDQQQGDLVNTALKVAVDKASHLFESLAEANEEKFQEAVEEVDQRVLSTAGEFFKVIHDGGATLRLIAGAADRSFGYDDIARAADRAESTTVEETLETLEGQLNGVLPDAHQFEFRVANELRIIRGTVDRVIPASDLANFNRTWVNLDARARFSIKRIRQRGEIVRESFTLLGIESPTSFLSRIGNLPPADPDPR